MNKLNILFLLAIAFGSLSTPSKARNHNSGSATSVNTSFSPTNASVGESVRFSWSSNNAAVCDIFGVPGLDSFETGGSFNFKATIGLSARVVCEGLNGPRSSFATFKINLPVGPPEITISYPDSVFTDDAFNLKISTINASSCTFTPTYNGRTFRTVAFATSFSERRAYSAPGTVIHSVECDGEGGKSQADHTVLIFEKPELPRPQILNFFVRRADQSNGDIALAWSTTNATRCELRSGNVSSNVPTFSLGFYANVPIGGRKFTLTCSNGSNSVSSILDIIRNKSQILNKNELVSEAESISPDRFSMVAKLRKLGFNLSVEWISYSVADLNGDGFDDVVIHNSKANTLSVLLNQEGTIGDSIKIVKDVYDMDDVHSIHVDENNAIRINLTYKLIK